jgi:predicted phage terminase large subunit-like protein
MEAIQKCVETDYGRLMIMAPPGSAKTTYAAVVTPSWYMSKFPGSRVLMTSYAARPIERASKRARQLVNSEEHASIFGTRLLHGSNAADEWELDNGSGLFAAGILGGINSSRCDLGIMDDLVSGREDADSETMRDKTAAAYDDDFITRLKPRASIIFINTRWHLNDQQGRILPADYDGRSGEVLCRDGQVWTVLNIQAQCERKDDPVGRKLGEYLWSEWFSERHWMIYKRNKRTWTALYQQRPVEEEGNQFKREAFNRYRDKPRNVTWYMPGDWAVTEAQEKTEPDWTVFAPVGIDADDNIFIEAGYREQADPEVTINAYIRMAKRYKATQGVAEGGVIRRAIESQMRRKMKRLKHWLVMHYLTTSADKTAMAASFRAMVAARQVYVQEGPWGDHFINECCNFPRSGKDDCVDMGGLIGRLIDKMHAPPKGEKVSKRKGPKPLSGEMYEAMEQQLAMEEAEQRRFYNR